MLSHTALGTELEPSVSVQLMHHLTKIQVFAFAALWAGEGRVTRMKYGTQL